MNKRENGILKMGQGTLEIINQNQGIWGTKVAFSRKVGQAGQHIAAILLLDSLLASKLSGYSTNKNAAKELMSNAAFDVAAPLLTFARDTNKVVLAEEINFHLTSLTKSQDALSRNRSQLVNDRAHTYLTDLPDYDITADQLTALKQLIGNFDDLLALPRAMSKTQQTARIDQKGVIKDLLKTLTDLDNLMVPFRNTHPSFYQTYTSARQLEKSGSRTVSVRGKVTDSITGVALTEVEVNVEGKAKQLGSAKGNFRLYSLAPGNYSLQVSRRGYVTQTVANVVVLEGKITRQEVVLVKG